MGETLIQALRLTLLGMGMTFASIAALALGMWVLTYVTRAASDKPWMSAKRRQVGRVDAKAEQTVQDGSDEPVGASDPAMAGAAATAVAAALADPMVTGNDGAVQAAAAAVAVAMAVDQAVPAGPVSVYRDTSGLWDDFVRGAHLSRRAYYDARKSR